jgi:hypothetical protein
LDIEDTSIPAMNLHTQFILGMAKIGGRLKILLDFDRAITNEECILLDQVAQLTTK